MFWLPSFNIKPSPCHGHGSERGELWSGLVLLKPTATVLCRLHSYILPVCLSFSVNTLQWTNVSHTVEHFLQSLGSFPHCLNADWLRVLPMQRMCLLRGENVLSHVYVCILWYRRLRQENLEFEGILGYKLSSQQGWLKRRQNRKQRDNLVRIMHLVSTYLLSWLTSLSNFCQIPNHL